MKRLRGSINKNKYTFLMVIITILFLVQMFTSLQSEADYLNGYIERNRSNIQKLMEVSIENKGNLTQSFYDLNITQDVALLLAKTQYSTGPEKDEMRLQLMEDFLPLFNEVKDLGVRQFQFHLPDGSSFLRLHKPAEYDDNLMGVRDTVKATIESKEFVHGFEEGRQSNGYRYVFPVMYSNTYVGSVEMSYNLRSIVAPVMSTYDLQGIFVMDRNEVLKKTHSSTSNYFEDTIFHQGYLDKAFPWENISANLGIPEKEFDELNSSISSSILKDHATEDEFKYILYDNQLIWAHTFDVNTYQGERVGTLVFYKNDPVLLSMVEHLNNTRVYIFSTSALLFTLMIISYFFFIKTSRQAIYDSLTSLHNRNYYKSMVENENIMGTILIMDIDDFKQVNDRYGHDEGDKVLKAIADIIKSKVRSTDIAMRWGGEEFMVILNDMSPEDGLSISKRLLETIENHSFNGIKLTASIGISALLKDKEQAIKEADQALYYVKRNGKNKALIYNGELHGK